MYTVNSHVCNALHFKQFGFAYELVQLDARIRPTDCRDRRD